MSSDELPPSAALIAQVRENLEQVQSRIAEAATTAGRATEDVTLIGVSKYVGATETAALLAAGCQLLGESRPQQLWNKAVDPRFANASWHMIGHMQRNKVARTLPLISLMHGVDSERLLKEINEKGASLPEPPRVLVEVNCSGDPEKHGYQPEELRTALEGFAQYESLQIVGLMTMAARQGGADVARKNFAQLRELRDELAPVVPANVKLDELSMGMSGDFEQAILEGSTLVRVGSALWHGTDGL